MGASAKPPTGYDKKTLAKDICHPRPTFRIVALPAGRQHAR
jgi:hypothetical protein